MELYGPFRREAIERGIPADQIDRFAEQLRFAIWVGGGDRSEDVVGQSGGLPRLPAGTEWPSERGTPLPFVASLDCAALPKVEKLPLPVDGSLLFFLDPEQAFDACSRGYDAYARVLTSPQAPRQRSGSCRPTVRSRALTPSTGFMPRSCRSCHPGSSPTTRTWTTASCSRRTP
ncbi:DUF1963 domain-containing protein [Micromonospora sp. WP24]|uniref:DUF1963 domain-containing protein n=1 Tax=Micromonospora sp. WP24 TaxID=2604469 RepID=UPI0011D371C5|nr:DUF1963 domain-containing protein [Micromonospora sp. WP24]TYB91450.1 DUF1963 domain-containing protein [Micromonospora sp. WP24]